MSATEESGEMSAIRERASTADAARKGPPGRGGAACGKVILLGEHAVVFGIPAIAVGIEHGVRAHASALAEGTSRLRVPAWGVDVGPEDEHFRRTEQCVAEEREDGRRAR